MALPTKNEGELPVSEAVSEIEHLEGLHEAIAQRTIGLTWMVWGLAVAAIFVTYSYVGVLFDAYAAEVEVLFAFLWAPWVALAAVITHQLWRSAGLVMPVDPRAERREGIVTGLVMLALIFGGLWIVHATGARLLEPATVLLALGAATAGLGLAGINARSRLERRLSAIAGGGLILVALVTTALVPQGGIGYAWLSLVAPVASVLAYFGVGGLLIARG